MKTFMSLLIVFFGLQHWLFAERTCFNIPRIKEVLLSNQSILHYNNKDYTIEIVEDLPIDSKDDTIIELLKKDDVHLKEASLSGTKFDSVCTYPVINKNEEKIGQIVITRTHRTCFRPKKVLHALHLGKSSLKYLNKEYYIDQSTLGDEQIKEGTPVTISLEQGIRDEVFENGAHKVICVYKAKKIESKENIGIIKVIRTIDTPVSTGAN